MFVSLFGWVNLSSFTYGFLLHFISSPNQCNQLGRTKESRSIWQVSMNWKRLLYSTFSTQVDSINKCIYNVWFNETKWKGMLTIWVNLMNVLSTWSRDCIMNMLFIFLLFSIIKINNTYIGALHTWKYSNLNVQYITSCEYFRSAGAQCSHLAEDMYYVV